MSSLHTMPTVAAVALRALRRHPDRVAFSGPSGNVTYAGAADLIGRFQRAFDQQGLTRGQRIALLTGNRVEPWCAAMAALASGLAISWLHPMGSFEDHLAQVAAHDERLHIVQLDHFLQRHLHPTSRERPASGAFRDAAHPAVPNSCSTVYRFTS